MTRAITDFPWINHLRNLDPSQQVEFFNNKILNIASNFIPNNYVKIQPKDPPWITNNLRRMIKKRYKQYKKIRNDCFDAINLAKMHT